MGIFNTLSVASRAAVNDIRAAWGGAPAQAAEASAFAGRSQEAQEMFSLIDARLEEARVSATARGEKPTLEDYRQACVAFGESDAGKAALTELRTQYPNLRWDARSYSNLSGQSPQGTGHNLSGFALSEPKKRAMTDALNLDSDGAISDFYTNIDFTGANLNNAYVDPATSFNDEIAKAGSLTGLTFNNMQEGDVFTFGAGDFKNIKMTNINGGKIIFDDKSRVDGLTIDGVSASISMGDRAHVNHISMNDDFRIVNLSMGEGALLSNSDLTKATISMASEFERGATLQNVQLGSNVRGLNFSGLTLNNVTIDGTLIQSTRDLDRFGISYDETTTASVSKDRAMEAQLAEIKKTMNIAVASIGKDTATAPSQPTQVVGTLAARNENDTLDGLARAQVITVANGAKNPDDPLAAAIAAMVASGVSRGAEASSAGAGRAVASLNRPERDDSPNLGSGNMQRSVGSASA